MANRSNDKGGEFERLMAKHLNKLHESEEFSRTPGSGALVGLSNFAKKMGLHEDVRRTLGSDLIVPEWYVYATECKWYKDKPNHAAVMHGSESNVDKWLGEVCYDAINFERLPLLFFKTNNRGIFTALPLFVVEQLNIPSYTKYGEFGIFSLQHYEENKDLIVQLGRDNLTYGLSWLENSPHISSLIEHLHRTKSKGK